jgi:RNA polymerase sigma-70 factor, ECF subfamily
VSMRLREPSALQGDAREEDALIRACQQGDSVAAGKLVDVYWERVFAYAYRLTQRRNDAEDLAQETFLHALRSLSSYQPDGRFRSWLLRIATNLFLDQRKSSRARDVGLDENRFEQPASAPADALDRKELIEALWEVLHQLTREQQVVVLLRAVEGMDYAEIAELLRTKEATARWHMYEARRILRQKLGVKFDLSRYRTDAAE